MGNENNDLDRLHEIMSKAEGKSHDAYTQLKATQKARKDLKRSILEKQKERRETDESIITIKNEELDELDGLNDRIDHLNDEICKAKK